MTSLGGITKSLLGAKTEFIIHCPKEYDYRYLSEKRSEIIEILKHRYAEKMNQNLPIYGVEKDRTNEFMTIEKDMKRGISRMPPSMLRLFTEDVIASDSSSKASVY